MDIFKILIITLISYLLGCLSLSIFLSKKVCGNDIRSCGSGNAGATNMARVYGFKMGLLTLAADVAKAVVSMLIGSCLLGDTGMCIAGCMCLVGHCFPALHGFKGGKGVSVGAAIIFFIDWRAGIITVAVFFLAAIISKRVSLGSICAAVSVFVSSLIFYVSLPRLILAAFTMIVVIVQHRKNIERLVKGNEPAFKLGHSK